MSLPTNEMVCSSKLRGVCFIADFCESMICFAFCGVRKFGVNGVWEIILQESATFCSPSLAKLPFSLSPSLAEGARGRVKSLFIKFAPLFLCALHPPPLSPSAREGEAVKLLRAREGDLLESTLSLSLVAWHRILKRCQKSAQRYSY